MPRPKPQAAISKAPTKTHPVAPTAAPDVAAEPQAADAAPPASGQPQEAMTVFSARISADLRRRVRVHAAVTGTTVQEITAAALEEYLSKERANDYLST